MDNWSITIAARRSLIETFDQLDDDQCKVPSLSDGWLILLHSLDVRIPLGLESGEPPAHYVPALGLLFGPAGRSFGGAGRPAVRWVGTDHEWSHGTGPEVRATMADLALVAGGWAEPLPRLDDDGAPLVEAWLG